jgi:hypothetical protein
MVRLTLDKCRWRKQFFKPILTHNTCFTAVQNALYLIYKRKARLVKIYNTRISRPWGFSRVRDLRQQPYINPDMDHLP